LLLVLVAAACNTEDPLDQARRNGRRIYLANCAPCHGVEADGNGERREVLNPPPRNHTDPAWRATVTEETVFAAISGGVPGTAMPAWSMLPDKDLRDLTTYVLSVAELGPRVDGE
jgi:high-affinity iron transporter